MKARSVVRLTSLEGDAKETRLISPTGACSPCLIARCRTIGSAGEEVRGKVMSVRVFGWRDGARKLRVGIMAGGGDGYVRKGSIATTAMLGGDVPEAETTAMRLSESRRSVYLVEPRRRLGEVGRCLDR